MYGYLPVPLSWEICAWRLRQGWCAVDSDDVSGEQMLYDKGFVLCSGQRTLGR